MTKMLRTSNSRGGSAISEWLLSAAGPGSGSWRAAAVLGTCLLLLAFSLRFAALIGQPLFIDELYAHFAAAAWNDQGKLALYDGEYLRASGFTKFIALITRGSGPNFFVERMPAAVAGALSVLVLFVWARRHIGLGAAAVAAFMLCIADVSLELSSYVRFYTLQGLFVLAAVALVYEATAADASKLMRASGVLAVPLLIVAIHLHVLTYIAVLGILTWVSLDLVVRHRSLLWSRRRLVAIILAAGACFSVVTGVALWRAVWAPLFLPLINQYFDVAAWNLPRAHQYFYYFAAMMKSAPILLILFPISAAIAWLRAPRFTGLCVVMFLTAFICLSIGGMKNERYLAFVLPFFFLVISTALLAVTPSLIDWARRAGAQPRAAGNITSGAMIAVCILSLLAVAFVNPIFTDSPGMIKRGLKHAISAKANGSGWPDDGLWTEEFAKIQSLVADSPVVVTADPFRTYMYLGGFDFAVESYLSPELGEFTTDPRTGRPQISTAESLRKIQSCFGSGVFLTTFGRWPDEYHLNAAFAQQLEESSKFILIGPNRRESVYVFRWSGTADKNDVDCPRITAMARRAE